MINVTTRTIPFFSKPNWTPPSSVLRDELFPHLKLDLSRHNDTLGLHAPDVSLLADGDEGLHLLPK